VRVFAAEPSRTKFKAIEAVNIMDLNALLGAKGLCATAKYGEAVVKEGALFRETSYGPRGRRIKRFFQLVHKGPSSKNDAQLVLLAFKKDPNPQNLQPPLVGAADSASAR
jgi:hypothetical protein